MPKLRVVGPQDTPQDAQAAPDAAQDAPVAAVTPQDAQAAPDAAQDAPVAAPEAAPEAGPEAGPEAAQAAPEEKLSGPELATFARSVGIVIPNLDSLAARKPERVRQLIADAREEAVFVLGDALRAPLNVMASAVLDMMAAIGLGVMPGTDLVARMTSAYTAILGGCGANTPVSTTRAPRAAGTSATALPKDRSNMTLFERQVDWRTGINNRITQQVPKGAGYASLTALYAALPAPLMGNAAAAALYLGWAIPAEFVAALPDAKREIANSARAARSAAIVGGAYKTLRGEPIATAERTLPNLDKLGAYPTA